jgi:RodZ C-terminal domain
MWIVVLLVAVSVLLILTARRRRIEMRDPVDSQRMHLDALRAATSRSDLAGGRTSPPEARSVRPLRSLRSGRRSGWPPPVGSKRALLIAAAALVLAVVGLVIAGIPPERSRDGTPARHAGSRPRSRTAPTTAPTTSTTTPPGAAVVGAQGGVITISVPLVAYRLTFTAHGSCWMRAELPDNTVVDTTTLQSGDSRELAESGPLTVRLGNPGVVDVAVDGQVLVLPVQNGVAVDLHFAPPGSPT